MANVVFFLLITLTLSSTIHARESQFFNKFSNKESQPLNTNNQQQQQQQQPEFIPQSQDSNSYGLYGQESSQLPPSTTTNNNKENYENNDNNYNNNNYDKNNNENNYNNYNKKNNLPSYLPANYNPVAYTTPIHASTQEIPNNEYNNDPNAYKYNGESRLYNSEEQEEEFTGTNGGDMYNSEKQGFDDARFMETEDGGNMYNSEKQVENGRYNQGLGGSTKYGTSNNANVYNSGKQGMSDTRFLENGKYFYDLNMENVNSNANMNTRGVNWKNEYNTQGYYGNNDNSYDRYNNNYNSNGGGYEEQEDQFNP